MIQHKVDGGIVSTDKVIVNVDGSDVEVLKVNVVQDDITSEIYPSAASKLRVMSNKDEDFSAGKLGGQVYGAPSMSHGDDSEIYVEVFPSNAAWYFEVHEDLNLDHLQYEADGVTTKIYYGNHTLSLDLVDLEETQEFVEQSFTVHPYKGEESNSVTFYFGQTKPVVADIAYELEFDFNETLQDRSRQFEFTASRDTYVDPDGNGNVLAPTDYEAGVNEVGVGLELEFNGEYADAPLNQYYVDLSSRIPWNWYETGMSISMVSSSFPGQVGFIERQDSEVPDVYKDGNIGNHLTQGYYYGTPVYEVGPGIAGTSAGVPGRIGGDAHSVITVSSVPLTDERCKIITERVASNLPHTFDGTVSFSTGSNIVTFTGFDLGDLRPSDTITFSEGPLHEVNKEIIVGTQINSTSFIANYLSNDEEVTENKQYTMQIKRVAVDIQVEFTPDLDDPETFATHEIQGQYLRGDINEKASTDHMLMLIYESYRNGEKIIKGDSLLVMKNLDWGGTTGVPLVEDEVYFNADHDVTIEAGISRIGHWYNQESSSVLSTPGNGIFAINVANESLVQTIPPQTIDHIGIVFERVDEGIAAAECKSWGIPIAGSVVQTIPPRAEGNATFRQSLALIDGGQYETYDDVPITNTKIKPMVLDDETLCIGGAMSYFWEERIKKEFPNTWVYEHNHYYGYQWWQTEFQFNSNWNTIKEAYYRRILYSWDDITNFTINDITDPGNPVEVNFSLVGRWTHPQGTLRFRSQWTDRQIEARDEAIANGDEVIPEVIVQEAYGGLMNNYDMNQYLYVKLENPLEQGHEYEVIWNDTGDHTNSGSIVYDENIPSRSIKVNQMGYVNDSNTSKKAYVGSWLGMLANKLEEPDESDADYETLYEEWRQSHITQEYRQYLPENNPRITGAFSIYRDGEDTPVYSKTAEESNFGPRNAEDRTYWNPAEDDMEGIRGIDASIHKWETGEKTYDLDFSDIDVPDGKYRIYIDGIGWSWSFFIGNEAAGRGMFIAHKGALELRSGMAFESPISPWEKPIKCPETFEGVAPTWDGSNSNGDITSAAGDFVGSQWQQYAYEKDNSAITGRRFRDVKGGWHDAADFDRRPLHIKSVIHLVEAYLADPDVFYDNQLQVPESGDGIPDILSEVEWGIRIWRQLQRDDGAVAMWIESSKHESGMEGQESDLEYVSGTHNTYDSLLYAHAAAMVAQAYGMVGTEKARARAAIYAESAARAYEFGREEDNLVETSWVMNGTVYTYNENVDKRKPAIYPAAAALYALTKNKKYADDLTDENFWNMWDLHTKDWGNNVQGQWSYALTLQIADVVPEHHDRYVTWLRLLAEFWTVSREKFAYRWAGSFSNKFEETKVSEDKYNMTMEIPALWAAGFSDFSYFAGDHIEGRAGHAYLHLYRLAKQQGNAEDIQHYKSQIQMCLDHNNGCMPTGLARTTGMGHTYPNMFLDYKMLRHIAHGIYTPTWGHSPYDGGQIPVFFSNFSGVSQQTWANVHGARSDIGGSTANQNMLPGGFIESLGDGGTAVASFLMNRVPKWRTQSYLIGAKNAGLSEWTVHETATGKVPMYSALMEPGWMPADEVKSPHIETEDRFNLDCYLATP